MGWTINEFENNTLKLTKKQAKELYAAQAYEGEVWDYPDSILDDGGYLFFNSDHMEHMDYLSNNDGIVAKLREFKIQGRVLFCSHEGDNAGEYWGHEFDGKGGYSPLVGKTGTITWVAAPAEIEVRNTTRLVYTEDGSSKFWEVRVDGKILTRRWGKIGTKGQTSTTAYKNFHEANAAASKMCSDKASKDYRYE